MSELFGVTGTVIQTIMLVFNIPVSGTHLSRIF